MVDSLGGILKCQSNYTEFHVFLFLFNPMEDVSEYMGREACWEACVLAGGRVGAERNAQVVWAAACHAPAPPSRLAGLTRLAPRLTSPPRHTLNSRVHSVLE